MSICNSITIADVKKMDAKPGDTLIVEVDLTGIPRQKIKTYMESAAKTLRAAIPNTSIQILVVAKGHVDFTVVPGNGMKSLAPTASDPLSDYDRAMKGL